MRSVRIASIVLSITILSVSVNAAIVGGIIKDTIERIENADTAEYEKIFEDFKSIEVYLNLSVDHEDMMNIELAFAELVSAAEVGDEDAIISIKSRLKHSLEHLKRLSGINIDSIF